MSFYEVGKEIELLKNRLNVLEKKLDVGEGCSCNFEALVEGGETQSQLIEGQEVASKSFNWGRNGVGKCEWREGYLTIFSDGRYEGRMNLRCNAGSFWTCTMSTQFRLLLPSDVEVTAFDAQTIEIGGATDKDITYSGQRLAIQSNFNQISSAVRSMRCRTAY